MILKGVQPPPKNLWFWAEAIQAQEGKQRLKVAARSQGALLRRWEQKGIKGNGFTVPSCAGETLFYITLQGLRVSESQLMYQVSREGFERVRVALGLPHLLTDCCSPFLRETA